MSKKHKNVYRALNAFSSLIGIPIGITSSAKGLKICLTTARIKNYKLRIKKKIRSKIKNYC